VGDYSETGSRRNPKGVLDCGRKGKKEKGGGAKFPKTGTQRNFLQKQKKRRSWLENVKETSGRVKLWRRKSESKKYRPEPA